MCTSLASRGVWWFLAMLVGFSASGQSFEESWELVDVGNCGGCAGLIAHDLDGDGVDEIITGGGWDWSYRRSNFVQVLRREGDAYKEWWTTGFYGVRMISRIVIHESPDSTSLFVILSTGQVQALDPMTGATRWSRDFAIESDVRDGAIVDLDGDGGLEIVLQSNFSVRAFDFESAAEKWQHPSQWPISFLVANLDLDSNLEVVFDNRDGNEAALIVDGASGEVEWT